MKIKFDNKKWSIESVFDYFALESSVPLVAHLAEYDIPEYYKDCYYTIVDGDLYCFHGSSGAGTKEWWFFDSSLRRWHTSDEPVDNIET